MGLRWKATWRSRFPARAVLRWRDRASERRRRRQRRGGAVEPGEDVGLDDVLVDV